ncbi:ATP-dependent bile acid permease [Taphrina deformans PYCC 5710]|uniref:ATP-dependent bile acid permease n=1 Tax=Taphrina deformans (strain PYCC 5710 / ATCC 11124 / CBS 356.35 / IMI 108563 / JCM 9778 / NBRC 8474) TaxID=1097556 RepID=R4X8A3_TAPDE|nr:ATP-dependent bile acid permease [Taphrina deformans PYCC 5710]|eukprot:CCG81763.1 ATP-dependent bile acid permease [Taphrina deformans PYCC 5710]
MRAFLACRSIWRKDDFTKCFHHDYIQTLFPVSIGIVSLLLITSSLSIHLAKSRRISYSTLDDVSQSSDETQETEHEIFTRASSRLLSTNTKEHFPRPRTEALGKAAEIFSGLALITLGVVGVIFSANKLVSAVQIVYWTYVTTLIGLQISRILSPTWSKTLFVHVVMMIILSWPLSFFRLRTVILKRTSHFDYLLEIFNFVFVSILFLVTVTTRTSLEPYKLKSKKGLPPTQEPLASLFSRAAFNWVDPVIWKGFFEAHSMDNVWDLREDDYAQTVLGAFTAAKQASSLTITLLKHFRSMLLIQGAWAFLYSIFTFAPTLLLKQILQYLEAPEDTPREVAWLYCAGLLAGSIFSTIGNNQALFIGRRICIKLRAIIIGEVYAKALRRRDNSSSGEEEEKSEGQANNGQIINLMAIDAFKVSEICAYLHYLVASVPVELVVAVTLLYTVLGWSALAGILAMIILLPANYWMSSQFSKIQEDLMKTTDIRINRMNELLNSIRIIKYFAWEQSFMKDINLCRQNELKQLKRRYIMYSIASLSWNASPVLITLLTFVTYTKLAGKDLTASVAFTSLSLFNVLRAPLDQLADMITNVLQSKVSLDRVAAFLSEEETMKYEILAKKLHAKKGPKIGFVDGTFTWASQKEMVDNPQNQSFQVRDLNIEFPVGELSVISGPTGSGKTSLLMALLGEMTPIKGDAYLPGARNKEDSEILPGSELIDAVAYCAQTAWLLNDTIRNNILFSEKYDEKRYTAVVKACALTRDLDILEHGDETEIGEKGITLSGGQKQRVSLARALYSRARHLILDDCLSAVDSHTAKWIFQFALSGSLVEDRTRLLVTHNVSLCLPSASHVVLLDNGRLTNQGTPQQLLEAGAVGLDDDALRSAISVTNSRAHSAAPSRAQSAVNISGIVEEQEGAAKLDAAETKKREISQAKTSLVQEENRAKGSVQWKVYGSYTKSLGGFFFWIFIAAAFLAQQGFNILQSYWIREWAQSYQTRISNVFGNMLTHSPRNTVSGKAAQIWFPTTMRKISSLAFQSSSASSTYEELKGNNDLNYYLGVYSLIALAFCVASLFRIVIVSLGSIRASQVIHEKLLYRVIHSKMRFFDSTPLGRIMNRFSKDLETIDQEIAMVALGFIHDSLAIVATVVLISLITPGFLIAGIVITMMYSLVGAFYVRSSRELKRLESVTRSPIYQHFGETLVGITTIRAYGDELRFISDNLAKIDTNNRPFYYLWACNRWLSVRVDLGGALVSFFAAVFVILNVESLDAGLAGISLTYAITFTDHVLWVVRLYAMNEMNMNSVERVSEYLDIEQEAPALIEKNRMPAEWPTKGEIDVKNLVLQYAPDLPAVIRDVTFHIKGGSKIGIVGRTGAGKSTIATAFFRLVEPTSGSIAIDGIDITTIGLRDLRQGLTIIPQDPTLFQRSLRFNLDPFNEHTDIEIFEALRRVHLIGNESTEDTEPSNGSKLNENVNVFLNLETAISEGGNNLSQGQRQLLCLARALLRLPKVIFMDESTASVDFATDSKIQKTIRTNFKESTILTIAHRLRSICDYDKILVLDQGSVVEYDHPYQLMTRETQFKEMCEHSGEFDVLLEMAKKAHLDRALVDDT